METRYIDSDALEIDEDKFACLRGEPFTGTAFVRDKNGEIISTTEYVSGSRQGWYKEWWNGQPAEQMLFHSHIIHGPHRRWHENGQLAYEALNFYALKLREQKWDASGELILQAVKDRADPNVAKKIAFVLRRVPKGQDIDVENWVAQKSQTEKMEVPSQLH